MAEDVIYVDPLAKHFLIGREAVREHFNNINSGKATGITRQEYHNEIARPLSENEVLLSFGFNTYKQTKKAYFYRGIAYFPQV
ncbi:hypothetical protein [Pasteurella sp. 19428wF3_WM03]|uniref:hypothetical protein n=1 Tax=Pasteurella sp. 19428wF3_WM03 TaxID=2782473 RepID=UPI0018833563